MATLPSNKFKDLLLRKVIDAANDVFKISLMATGFTFDRTADDVYADISASELTTAYGYTAGGYTLTGVTITRDDVNHIAYISWNNPTWTATGGDIVACGAIIYDDTVAAPVAKPVIGFIDFTADITAYDTGPFAIADITVAV